MGSLPRSSRLFRPRDSKLPPPRARRRRGLEGPGDSQEGWVLGVRGRHRVGGLPLPSASPTPRPALLSRFARRCHTSRLGSRWKQLSLLPGL